jgi:hypothetical protein
MTFAGDVPVGWRAQLMRSNADRLVDGASAAARVASAASATTGGEPSLALAVSCVGRRLVLGERTEEEIRAVRAELPPGTELSGFYAYGEISPRSDGVADLHNQTMTVTLISERRL